MEPRQGTNINSESIAVNDGSLSVYATPYPEIAVFRALINSKNIPFPHTSAFSAFADGTMKFRVSSKKVLDQVRKDKCGYVYVLDRTAFHPYSRTGETNGMVMEWRSANVSISFKDYKNLF
ncbi:hypothetical protein CL644_02625 [bacterium]|nr:hypothetical protein [bacterium]